MANSRAQLEWRREIGPILPRSRRRLPWSDEDNAVLAALYPTGGWIAVQRELPRRTKAAIFRQACRRGIEVDELIRYPPPPHVIRAGEAMSVWRGPVDLPDMGMFIPNVGTRLAA